METLTKEELEMLDSAIDTQIELLTNISANEFVSYEDINNEIKEWQVIRTKIWQLKEQT